MQPGDVVGGRFRVLGPVATARGGGVFSAEGPEGRVCVKVWGLERDARLGRLEQVTAAVAHAGIARLKHHERHPQGLLVVEDLVAEPAMPLPGEPAHVLGWLTTTLSALAACHQANVVHGRLTPWRIGRAADGRFLMRGLDGAITSTSPVDPLVRASWSPAWAAPEQAGSGPVDARADLYTAALIAAFLLTGKPPPVLPSEEEVGSGWHGILARALDRDPAQRFPSATAMQRAVKMLAKIAAASAPTRGAVTGTVLEEASGTVIAPPFGAASRGAEASLPFVPGGVVPPAEAPAARIETGTLPAGAEGSARPKPTPFAPAAQTTFAPPVVPRAFAPIVSLPMPAPPAPAGPAPASPAANTVFGAFRLDAGPSLPFREAATDVDLPAAPAATAAEPAGAPATTGTVFGARAADVVTPFAPRADSHVARVSEDPEARLPLERYARVRAELWASPERFDDILERHGLDRIGWHCYEDRELRGASDAAAITRLFDAARAGTRRKR